MVVVPGHVALKSLPKKMASNEEDQKAYIRASKAAWKRRNREACRVYMAAYRERPGMREKRSDAYYAKRALLLEQGLITVGCRGRPRKITSHEEHKDTIDTDPEKTQLAGQKPETILGGLNRPVR